MGRLKKWNGSNWEEVTALNCYQNGEWKPEQLYLRCSGEWIPLIDYGYTNTWNPDIVLNDPGAYYDQLNPNYYADTIDIDLTCRFYGLAYQGNYTLCINIRYKVFVRVEGGSWQEILNERRQYCEKSSTFTTELIDKYIDYSHSLVVPSDLQDKKIEVRVEHDDEWHNEQGYFTESDREKTWTRLNTLSISNS